MKAYCGTAPRYALHGPYHSTEYGFSVTDESFLFEFLVCEIFQAGFSWLIVLTRREGPKFAFDNFRFERVAAFTDPDVERLLQVTSILRNGKK